MGVTFVEVMATVDSNCLPCVSFFLLPDHYYLDSVPLIVVYILSIVIVLPVRYILLPASFRGPRIGWR